MLLILPILILLAFFPIHVYGFMTTALLNLGIPDIIHTYPNDNSTSSCMNIGIASGYQAGKDTKENQLAYSLVGGVGGLLTTESSK